ARAPDIEVRLADASQPCHDIAVWQATRPSLTFSVNPLAAFRPSRGKIYEGRALDKLSQLERLTSAGVPMPKAVLLRPNQPLDERKWGEFVIAKPAGKGSSKGQLVRLVRTSTVAARFDELTKGGQIPMMIQRYVDSADLAGRIYEYRVLTMFSRPIYMLMGLHVLPQPPLAVVVDRMGGEIAYNRKGVKRKLQLVIQQDALDLAIAAANAIPEYPCHGIDIARERTTGRLFVLETNPGGFTWHISSPAARGYPPEVRDRLYSQFNALDTAADALIERTRAEAS
ncbi:MAG: hypothetical protein ABI399_04105, partial [Bauldia sp.]